MSSPREGLARSVQVRLARHAREIGVDPNLVLTRYAVESAARLTVQVDVGVGDAVTPAPEWLDYPGLLDLPSPTRVSARKRDRGEAARHCPVWDEEQQDEGLLRPPCPRSRRRDRRGDPRRRDRGHVRAPRDRGACGTAAWPAGRLRTGSVVTGPVKGVSHPQQDRCPGARSGRSTGQRLRGRVVPGCSETEGAHALIWQLNLRLIAAFLLFTAFSSSARGDSSGPARGTKIAPLPCSLAPVPLTRTDSLPLIRYPTLELTESACGGGSAASPGPEPGTHCIGSPLRLRNMPASAANAPWAVA